MCGTSPDARACGLTGHALISAATEVSVPHSPDSGGTNCRCGGQNRSAGCLDRGLCRVDAETSSFPFMSMFYVSARRQSLRGSCFCATLIPACVWCARTRARLCTGAGSDEHEPKSQQVLHGKNASTNPEDAKDRRLHMTHVASGDVYTTWLKEGTARRREGERGGESRYRDLGLPSWMRIADHELEKQNAITCP